MSREEYVQYLRDQAQLLQWVADEVEAGETPLTEWMVDWTLKRENALLDAQMEYRAELAASIEKGVA